MTLNRISSIGWLYGVEDSIILTPCVDENCHPTKLRISRAEFEGIRHDETLMKQKACDLLS
jgi:hypothetical protein